jgi:hypothetical protein
MNGGRERFGYFSVQSFTILLPLRGDAYSGDTLTSEYVIPKGIFALQLCYNDDCLVSLIL